LYEILIITLFILSGSASSDGLKDWDDLVVLLFITTCTGVASFYTFYLWLMPSYLTAGQIRTFIGLGLAVILAWSMLVTIGFSLLVSIILYFTFQKFEFLLFSSKDQVWLIAAFFTLALVNGVLGTLFKGFITWFVVNQEKQALVTNKLKTELSLLKAQINPHFLFNTLNNIDVLINLDQQKASSYLNKLSDLLRYVLYETQAEWVSLTKELEHLKKYIELQKIRTANQDFVVLKIEGVADYVIVPPMILIPYIENAFKYASNKKDTSAIHISITIKDFQIWFQCRNNINKNFRLQPECSNGLGNRLLKQRLFLIYRDSYLLDTQSNENEYIVNLTLPVKTHEVSVD
jgi:sensor histidine kinase YesM